VSWNSTWPNGSQSVKTNQSTGAANTTYIKTTMNVDHYWDNSGDNDGHHQWVQMPMQGTAGSPTDAALATGMDGALYAKAKATTEAVDNQDVQPFYINNKAVGVPGVTQVMQLLGIRAMGVFDRKTSNGAVTLQYSHNCTVSRSATGVYTATFTTALPSDNYLALGGCVRSASSASSVGIFTMSGGTSLALKTVSSFQFRTFEYSGSPSAIDPLQTWFVVFGG
jgi:hypothetical protein